MSENTYKDYIPANARVYVDYTKGKGNRVKFSYPKRYTYKQAVWKCAYKTIASFWIKLNIKIAMIILIPAIIVMLIIKAIQSPAEVVTAGSEMVSKESLMELVYVLVGFAGGIAYTLGLPAIATYFLQKDKELLGKLMPIIGYYSARMEEPELEQVY